MFVFDMAGTTVNEGGTVYKTLKNTLDKYNVPFTNEEFDHFHGISKSAVLEHFIKKSNLELNTTLVVADFYKMLQEAYDNADLKPMDGSIELFKKLREKNILVCLDTGYGRNLADKIIERIGFREHIDGSCTSDEVAKGRPYPYMINNLVEKFNLESAQQVVKVGDTVADVKEGKNAQTKYTISVLTGADSRETLEKENPDYIFNDLNGLIDFI